MQVEKKENRFLELNWKQFFVLSTVVTAFFPWSLIISAIFMGFADTKQLIEALFDDWIKTMFFALLGTTFFITVIIYLVLQII